PAALAARQCDGIDAGAVEVHALPVALALPELSRRADDDPVAALRAPPDRERDAPVPLSGYAPVPEVLRPAELPAGTGPGGIPPHPPDLVDHLRLDARDLEETLDRGAEQDRRLAPQTMDVRMN